MARKSTKLPRPKRSAEEMRKAFALFYNRLFRLFVPYLWHNRFHQLIVGILPELPSKRTTLLVIRNACVETALIGLRDLDDFFSARRKEDRGDALRACDFGFRPSCQVLSREERSSINTHVVHLSYAPVLVGTAGLSDDTQMTWDLDALVRRVGAIASEFFDHTERNPMFCSQQALSELSSLRVALDQALRELPPSPPQKA